MLLHSVLIAILFALPALISGEKVPVVDGVVDGVPSPDACKFETQKGPFSYDASAPGPTLGKLRGVVENSGVCGGLFCFTTHPVSY
jgi:hypothetical protein